MATVCMVAACAGTRNDTSTTTASAMPSEPSGVLGPSPTEASPAFTRIALPDLGGGLVVAGGTLWDATDSGAVQIDTTSGTVSEAIRGVTNLAFDGERLWAGGEKLLLELDPRSGEVLQRFAPDYNALYLAASPDAVWATDTFTGMVRRIDPSDGRVVATIEVPLVPKGTRLGEGALWIACDAAATVVRINTSTNEIEAQIAVGQGPHTIATGGGAVWVTNRHSSTLSKIDPTTNQVVATVKDVATSPNVGVDVGPKSVYVGYAGGLAMVDPDLAEITKRIDVGGISFYDLRVMDDVLWASNGSRPDVNGFYLQVLSD
jgi:YVTN family beta-propeller protein